MELFLSLTKQTPSLPSRQAGQAPQVDATHYRTLSILCLLLPTEDTYLDANSITKFDSTFLTSWTKLLHDADALVPTDLARLCGIWDCRTCYYIMIPSSVTGYPHGCARNTPSLPGQSGKHQSVS